MTIREGITRYQEMDILSTAVVHNGIAYLSGFTAEPPDGKDIREQTRETLAAIETTLTEVSSSKSRLLTAQIWLSDINDFDAMNAEWMDWLGTNGRPTRACVRADLAGPHYLVEIMVTAAL